MIKDSCIIDGIDIGTLGMFIVRGGDYGFLTFPERKEPEQNNWHEYDGVDADLSEIFFKEKRLTVHFYIAAATAIDFIYNLNTFYTLISAPGYRQLYSREFGKTFSLRYISSPELDHRGGLYKSGQKSTTLSVEFSMDDPLQIFTGATNLVPRNGHSIPSRVSVNGIDLADFGIIVNQCYNSVLKLPAVKTPLTRSFARKNGLQAFTPAQTIYEKKQVTIDCTMVAASRDDFYYNYEALFNNLTILEQVEFSTYDGNELSYYSSMSGFEKLIPFSNGVLVKFSLAITLFDPGLRKYVWGTIDENIFGTVNNKAIRHGR